MKIEKTAKAESPPTPNTPITEVPRTRSVRKSRALKVFWRGNVMGFPDTSPWSLPNATKAAGEGHRPDEAGNGDRKPVAQHESRTRRLDPHELAGRDESRGAAPESVEDAHELGHVGHLHGTCSHATDQRADHHAGHDGGPTQNLVFDQRRDDGDEHGQCGQAVPSTSRGGGLEAFEADNKKDGRKKVGKLRPKGEIHGLAASFS